MLRKKCSFLSAITVHRNFKVRGRAERVAFLNTKAPHEMNCQISLTKKLQLYEKLHFKKCMYMNTLILTDSTFREEAGGMELYCNVLSELNKDMGNKVFKATVLRTNQPDVLTLKTSNFPILRSFFDRPLIESIEKMKKKFKIDLIHANLVNPRIAHNFANAVQELRLPIVLTVHGWGYLCPSPNQIMLTNRVRTCEASFVRCASCNIQEGRLLRMPLRKTSSQIMKMLYQIYSFKALLKRADAIISPSKLFAIELWRRLGIKAYHLPNPVNPKLLVERPKLQGDGSILFIGRLIFQKGVTLLPRIAKSLPHVTMHILGRGKLGNWLFRNKYSNMIYHGFVEEKEKLKLMKKTSVVIVPSIYQEMYPYTVSEALALGKPVVAFDFGGPKEMIEMSGGGLIAEPFEIKDFAEKVKYLLENPSEAKKRGLMGRKWVEENLRTDRYAEKLVKVYGCAEGCRYD